MAQHVAPKLTWKHVGDRAPNCLPPGADPAPMNIEKVEVCLRPRLEPPLQ